LRAKVPTFGGVEMNHYTYRAEWSPAHREYLGRAPTPLTQRPYSGRFLVRTSTALHKRLAIEAAEERVPLNQWVVQKLSGRKPRSPWEDF
jgi:predicted HicB family RNase H-like nuclease